MSGEYSRDSPDGDNGFYTGPTDGSEYGGQAATPTATTAQNPSSPAVANGPPKAVEDVMYSDIGVTTLLNRLKQSIASARDFAAFLKKRSSLEEEQATGLKRLAKAQLETVRRAEVRSGSYARQMIEVFRLHEKLADNGMQFALSLHQMHEDLNELSNNVERGRKQWKHEGLDAEKKATDAEQAMQKAKARYDSLAEDYDRARTGDSKGSRRIGLKGPKSAEQHEQDLLRKTQTADAEYEERVRQAQLQRQSLISDMRPKTVRALQELIRECDSGLALQLQKFATFNEKLLLSNGLAVSPLAEKEGVATQKSLRDVVADIDNEKDFHSDMSMHATKIPSRPSEIVYEQHSTLAPKQQRPTQPATTQQPPVVSQVPNAPPTLTLNTGPSQLGSMNTRYGTPPPQQQQQQQQPPQPPPSQLAQQPPPQPQHFQTFSPPTSATYLTHQNQDLQSASGRTQSPYTPQHSQPPPSREFFDPPSTATPPYEPPTGGYQPPPEKPEYISSPAQSTPPPAMNHPSAMTQSQPQPQTYPVFGVSLDTLFSRDQSAVPMIVFQCLQAVDLFGLDVEGIYRQSGTATHVNALRNAFDTLPPSAPQLDFRNPANFFHDVNSVTTLLKQFFRDLPDPLFTRVGYNQFIEAASVEDDTGRRDAMHQGINDLPDPNYATMRALVLHLNRVMQNESRTRMGSSNLAVCLAPSLMGTHTGAQIAHASLQARVVDTILINATAIFDED